MRGKTPEDRRLIELLDPVAEAAGYAIVRLRLMGGERRRLQVMAERPSDGDMGIDDCTRLSRALSAIFDAAPDLVTGEFTMEVSSPGIDRPLTRLADFTTYEGLEARLELDRMAEGRKRFKGVLAGVDGDNVGIDLDDEDHTALIPFAWIIDAKLVLSDEILKRGAEQRAARIEDGEEEDEYDVSDIPPSPDADDDAELAPVAAAAPQGDGVRRPRVAPEAPPAHKGQKAKKKTKPKPKSNSRKSSIFSGD